MRDLSQLLSHGPLPGSDIGDRRGAGVHDVSERLAPVLRASLDPEAAIGSALAALVRHVLRGEIEARAAAADTPRSPWVTPPVAARLTRIPVKTIRAWARTGRIPKRIKNRSADPKQQKYLVNVEDVVAVAEQVADAPAETSDKLELQQRAQQRAAQVLAARAAKGR